MAIIHISRAEAVNNFDALIGRAGNGDEVLIEENASPIAVLQAPIRHHVRLLSESLKLLRERGSTATLDGDFGRDLEAVINSHPEPLSNPWD